MGTCGQDNRDQERMVETRRRQDQQEGDMKFLEGGVGLGVAGKG